MIEFIDRVPSANMSNKKVIEYSDGRSEVVTITAADNASPVGTPINRNNLMAIQGFIANTIKFNADGSITETNGNGETLTTTFGTDGKIIEKFVGQKTLTKTTSFNADGSIKEVIS